MSTVWQVGNDVDTDQLAPGAYMKFGIDIIASHCLENTLPGFARDVRPGDLLVAGENFGCGSSREQAAAVLVQLGIRAVVARSYAGLFYRNAFNLGLLLLQSPEPERLLGCQQFELEPVNGRIRADEQLVACDAVPGFLLEYVAAGGLLPWLKLRRQAMPRSTQPKGEVT